MTGHWTTRDIPRQDGKRVIVTGGNSGIGWYTALALARVGAEVTFTSRTQQNAERAKSRIQEAAPGAVAKPAVLDLANPNSVTQFADQQLGDARPIDILINNAGVMALPKRETSPDGHELQFATNVLGPFRLTGLLLPAILAAAAPRVVTVSSVAHTQGGPVPIQDLDSVGDYKPFRAYSKTKLANILFTRELQRRAGDRLLSVCSHPGAAKTNLATNTVFWLKVTDVLVKPLAQDASMGAVPTLMAATCSSAKPGAYYGPGGLFNLRGHPIEMRTAPFAYDAEAGKDLFAHLESMTGIRYPI